MPGAPITGGPQPPLQTSGPIGLSDINNQFERAWNAEISLRLAETGYYAAINTNSPMRPGASTPAALSEWYGYYHAATMPTHTVLASAYLLGYITDGVTINANVAEAAPAAVTLSIRVYWINDLTSEVISTTHSGVIGATGYGVNIDCYPSGFGYSFQSVAVIGASPNPNYDQQYIW